MNAHPQYATFPVTHIVLVKMIHYSKVGCSIDLYSDCFCISDGQQSKVTVTSATLYSLSEVTLTGYGIQLEPRAACRGSHRARTHVWSEVWRHALTAGHGWSHCSAMADTSAVEISSTISGSSRLLTVVDVGKSESLFCLYGILSYAYWFL